MPINIADAENAFLAGKADVDAWTAEFLDEWYGPLRETMLLMMWDTLSDAEKQELKRINPQAYDNVNQQVEKIKTRR